MKVSVLAAIASCILLSTGFAGPADASVRKITNIPAESLSDALRTLAKDRQFEILYRAEVVRDVRTEGAVGEFTPEEALKALLSGTGLSYKYLDSNTVTVFSQAPISDPPAAGAASHGADEPNKGGGKQASQDFRVAQVGQANPRNQVVSTNQSSSTSNQNGGPALTEIIVTAQKREERMQDVPVPISVLSADALVESNLLRLQDYYTRIPGLNVIPGDESGAASLSIRGITTGGTSNPTVGVVVDDVPFGASTDIASGFAIPDIDPSELARIEVLKGPQGTLYGASSMGGLLKFVTVDPSTEAFSGRVEAGLSGVYNGGQTGYNVRGAVNVPLGDTLAIRISGFTRTTPGYVDEPARNIRGINQEDAYGGRFASLWRPSEDFSLKVSALLQDTNLHGSPNVYLNSGLGELQQIESLPGTGEYRDKLQVYSATFRVKLAGVDLTAISGYGVNKQYTDVDTSASDSVLTEPYFHVPGDANPAVPQTDKLTQEIRLASEAGRRLEWLLGAYFNRERSSASSTEFAENNNGAIAGTYLQVFDRSAFTEYAVFGDTTFHFTDRLDVQIGARESQNSQHYGLNYAGQGAIDFFGATPFAFPTIESKDNSFTYLLTPRFKVSPDFMLYARMASGYRPGGPNINLGSAGTPTSYGPDKTLDFDLGAKGNIPDLPLSFDVSLYYIDWRDIQVLVFNPSFTAGYFTNANRAKSEGLEVSLDLKPLAGMTVSVGATYNVAELTDGFPPRSAAVGNPGDRLPYGSRFSGNLSVEQDFPLGTSATGHVGGDLSYVGDRQGVFASSFAATPARQDYPGYTKVDLRGGARYGTWMLNLYANNVFDKRGLLTGGIGTSPSPMAFVYIQPRTIGMNATKTF